MLCGYLEPDLKSVADDILLETAPEPFALAEERGSELRVEARDLRAEPEPEPEPERETTEIEAVAAVEPARHQLEGVTESADWGWNDPEDYSAPV